MSKTCVNKPLKSVGVYLHCRPDGRVFYIGKGTKKRAYNTRRYGNKFYCNIVKKYGRDKIIVKFIECKNDVEAFNLEIQLIKQYQQLGHELVNATDGGKGGHLGKCHSSLTRQKMSQALKGRSAWNKGRKASRATKLKMSQAHLGHPVTQETREKLRLAFQGKPLSLQTRLRLSQAQVGKKRGPRSVITKLKISKKMKEHYAKIKRSYFA